MGSWILAVLTAASAGILGAVCYERYADPQPRFVVVDVQKMLEPIATATELSDEERRVRARVIAEALKKSADEYASQGFIVLDASAVLKAPEETYVQPY